MSVCSSNGSIFDDLTPTVEKVKVRSNPNEEVFSTLRSCAMQRRFNYICDTEIKEYLESGQYHVARLKGVTKFFSLLIPIAIVTTLVVTLFFSQVWIPIAAVGGIITILVIKSILKSTQEALEKKHLFMQLYKDMLFKQGPKSLRPIGPHDLDGFYEEMSRMVGYRSSSWPVFNSKNGLIYQPEDWEGQIVYDLEVSSANFIYSANYYVFPDDHLEIEKMSLNALTKRSMKTWKQTQKEVARAKTDTFESIWKSYQKVDSEIQNKIKIIDQKLLKNDTEYQETLEKRKKAFGSDLKDEITALEAAGKAFLNDADKHSDFQAAIEKFQENDKKYIKASIALAYGNYLTRKARYQKEKTTLQTQLLELEDTYHEKVRKHSGEISSKLKSIADQNRAKEGILKTYDDQYLYVDGTNFTRYELLKTFDPSLNLIGIDFILKRYVFLREYIACERAKLPVKPSEETQEIKDKQAFLTQLESDLNIIGEKLSLKDFELDAVAEEDENFKFFSKGLFYSLDKEDPLQKLHCLMAYLYIPGAFQKFPQLEGGFNKIQSMVEPISGRMNMYYRLITDEARETKPVDVSLNILNDKLNSFKALLNLDSNIRSLKPPITFPKSFKLLVKHFAQQVNDLEENIASINEDFEPEQIRKCLDECDALALQGLEIRRKLASFKSSHLTTKLDAITRRISDLGEPARHLKDDWKALKAEHTTLCQAEDPDFVSYEQKVNVFINKMLKPIEEGVKASYMPSAWSVFKESISELGASIKSTFGFREDSDIVWSKEHVIRKMQMDYQALEVHVFDNSRKLRAAVFFKEVIPKLIPPILIIVSVVFVATFWVKIGLIGAAFIALTSSQVLEYWVETIKKKRLELRMQQASVGKTQIGEVPGHHPLLKQLKQLEVHYQLDNTYLTENKLLASGKTDFTPWISKDKNYALLKKIRILQNQLSSATNSAVKEMVKEANVTTMEASWAVDKVVPNHEFLQRLRDEKIGCESSLNKLKKSATLDLKTKREIIVFKRKLDFIEEAWLGYGELLKTEVDDQAGKLKAYSNQYKMKVQKYFGELYFDWLITDFEKKTEVDRIFSVDIDRICAIKFLKIHYQYLNQLLLSNDQDHDKSREIVLESLDKIYTFARVSLFPQTDSRGISELPEVPLDLIQFTEELKKDYEEVKDHFKNEPHAVVFFWQLETAKLALEEEYLKESSVEIKKHIEEIQRINSLVIYLRNFKEQLKTFKVKFDKIIKNDLEEIDKRIKSIKKINTDFSQNIESMIGDLSDFNSGNIVDFQGASISDEISQTTAIKLFQKRNELEKTAEEESEKMIELQEKIEEKLDSLFKLPIDKINLEDLNFSKLMKKIKIEEKFMADFAIQNLGK